MFGLKNRVVVMTSENVEEFNIWMEENVSLRGNGMWKVQGCTRLYHDIQDVKNYFMKEFIAECVEDLKFQDRRDWYGE